MKVKPRANGKKDVPPALHALRRAAKRAVALGRSTGTPVYVLERTQIVDIAKRKTAKTNRKSHK